MKQITLTSKKHYRALLASIVLTLGVGLGSLHAQTFSYSDSGTANAITGVNYYTTADGNSAGGTGGAFTVTEGDPGLLTGASLKVASGSLTIKGTEYGIFNAESGTATLDVSGGALTLTTIGAVNQFGTTAGIYFGAGGTLNYTQESGTTTIDAQSGFFLGNGTQSGVATAGNVTLTNGLLDDIDTVGTTFNNGIVTLGSGTFEESGTNALTFTNGDINFLTGSKGSVSLLGETLAGYTTLINNGDILIGGSAATASQFSFASTGGQGVLTLASAAAAPEPSTWAMLLAGFLVLLGVQRKRFLQS